MAEPPHVRLLPFDVIEKLPVAPTAAPESPPYLPVAVPLNLWVLFVPAVGSSTVLPFWIIIQGASCIRPLMCKQHDVHTTLLIGEKRDAMRREPVGDIKLEKR